MTIGPEPINKIVLMSVRLGIDPFELLVRSHLSGQFKIEKLNIQNCGHPIFGMGMKTGGAGGIGALLGGAPS